MCPAKVVLKSGAIVKKNYGLSATLDLPAKQQAGRERLSLAGLSEPISAVAVFTVSDNKTKRNKRSSEFDRGDFRLLFRLLPLGLSAALGTDRRPVPREHRAGSGTGASHNNNIKTRQLTHDRIRKNVYFA